MGRRWRRWGWFLIGCREMASVCSTGAKRKEQLMVVDCAIIVVGQRNENDNYH